MSRPPKFREDKRTTVSLAKVVWDWASEMMRAKGYNDNFSAYIADLIRRDKEREEDRKAIASGKYPAHRDQAAFAAEDASSKKANEARMIEILKSPVMGKKTSPPK